MTLYEYKLVYKVLKKIASMDQIGNEAEDNQLPVKIALAIVAMEPTISVYNQSLDKVKNKYKDSVVKDDNGKPVIYPDGTMQIVPELIPLYQQEIVDIGTTMVDVIPTFKFDINLISRNYKLIGDDYIALMPFLITE